MATLERYSSFKELKAAGKSDKKASAAYVAELEAFFEALRKSKVSADDNNSSQKTNLETNGQRIR